MGVDDLHQTRLHKFEVRPSGWVEERRFRVVESLGFAAALAFVVTVVMEVVIGGD